MMLYHAIVIDWRENMTEWLKKAIFYEIYPQSFNDSNGDGIGDIPGIIQKLGYIKELGCNAIWINPCFVSPFYDAGYDVEDYYQIAPRYGTNEDMRQLFQEAHKFDIHVLLDLVPGHTAITHPWFLESMKPEKNKYTDRYIWTDTCANKMENIRGIQGTLRGISERNGTCGVNCFTTQPALNYGFAQVDDAKWQQPVDAIGPMETREELKNIMRFWLNMGCDGFRVDMAGSLVKNEDDDKKETIKLWQEVRKFLEDDFPDAVLVSEWGRPDVALKAGFHMDFFLHFGDTGYMDLFRAEHPFFAAEGKGDISMFVKTYKKNQQSICGRGLMCMPSGNHDMERISYKLTTEELKIAYAFIYSLPGAPFLYYGDEIGMRYIKDMISVEGAYDRTGSRTPMQWDRSTNNGFSTAPPAKLYMAIDPDPDRPDVATQREDPNSLSNTIKQLIDIRKQHKALQNDSDIEFLYAEELTYPLVYERRCEQEQILVLCNPSDRKQECPDFGIQDGDYIYLNGEKPRVLEKNVIMAPCSVCFIKRNHS